MALHTLMANLRYTPWDRLGSSERISGSKGRLAKSLPVPEMVIPATGRERRNLQWCASSRKERGAMQFPFTFKAISSAETGCAIVQALPIDALLATDHETGTCTVTINGLPATRREFKEGARLFVMNPDNAGIHAKVADRSEAVGPNQISPSRKQAGQVAELRT